MATITALQGFTPTDFDVFTIEGFAPRMEALKATVRPKLTAIGDALAPRIAAMIGEPVHPHVAKHARRTVNPPDDTWVAFSTNPRGYKALPHFQVGLWSSHLFVRFATIYESPAKAIVARQLLANPDVVKSLPADYLWSWDHMQPGSATMAELGKAGWKRGLDRAINVKKGELLVGIDLDPTDKRVSDGRQLLSTIEATIETLVPIYRLAFGN